jgi:hypothetical protein
MSKSIVKIEKNGMYGFRKNLEQHGVSLVVLEIEGEEVRGMRLLLKGNENFVMKKDAIYSLIDRDMLRFIEILPGFVIKDVKKGYLNNLKNYNSAV